MELKDDKNNLDSNIKNKFKIQIVDISKKKKETLNNKIQDKLKTGNINSEKVVNNLFDSMIYIGGGFIIAAETTSKILSKIGTSLINK
ncbi:MAG: hypothetical protein ACK4IX_10545 [Candidatus Sericytochromatia bacterium]